MGSIKKNKQGFRVGVLVLALVVCVWLIPAGAGIAAAASSSFKVTVTVEDSIGINVGEGALLMSGDEDVVTAVITQAAPQPDKSDTEEQITSTITLTASKL